MTDTYPAVWRLVADAVTDGILTAVKPMNPPGQDYEARGIHFGTVDGKPLTIDVRLAHRIAPEPGGFETIWHERVNDYWELSVSGSTPDSAGQITEALAGLDDPTPQAAGLANVWKRWHLNGMSAGCAHQVTTGRGSDRTAPPCPATGYRYGHAWLAEPLPPVVVSILLAALRTQVVENTQTAPEPYGFHKFIAARTVGMKLSGPRFTTDENGWEHRAWTCTLKLDGRTLRTRFRQGMAYTEAPTTAEVLSAVVSDADIAVRFASAEDFADEMGDDDLVAARRVYRAYAKMRDRLTVWLGDANLLDELAQLESV